MENLWQRKCGTMWQSTAASVVSSSLEPQNQILNAGYHFRSCVQAKPTSSTHRMTPETLLPWTSRISSYNVDHAELGSSLLSLLSGPYCVTPGEMPIGSCNASGFATVNEASFLSSGILSPNLGSQNVGAGTGLCSVLSSKARVTANQGCKSGPNNVLQDAYLNIEGLEPPKAGIHQNLFSNENRLLFPSLRVGFVNGSIPSNAWKLHNSHSIGLMHKTDPSVSCSSSTLTTDCPRVFCLNLCGDLLLSDTGLLGVVCSCHGLHMSITKFSEHSGLCNMNPGDAVRMDSGETIAHWRKVYFPKLGFRIPEDHCGWDWPEGLSVTAGLVKHCPPVPGVFKNSDLCNQDISLGASVQSFNPWNNSIFPKNFHAVQKVPDQVADNEKQRNPQEFLSSSLKNNFHSVADNPKMMYLTSESSAMSNVVGVKGPDYICQAVPSYIRPISKSGDSSVCHTHLQNLKTLGKDIDIGRNSGSLVYRNAVSSSVELRLGQPSQQGQSSGSSVPTASGSHRIDTHGQPPNSFFLEQHVPKNDYYVFCNGAGSSKSAEDRMQHSCLANCISSSSKRTEQRQLYHVNQIRGVSNAVLNASQVEQFKGDAASCSINSRSVACLKYPLDGRIHSKSINDGSHVMFSKVHSESPIVKPDQFSFPLFRGETADREFSSNLPRSQKHGNSESERCAIGSFEGAAELSFGSHTKSKERMWSFGGGESGCDRIVNSAGKDESTIMCRYSGAMTDEPDRGNTFNYFGQAFYPDGQLVSNASRSVNSPMNLRRVLSTQAVSMGFSATNHLSIQCLTPLSKKENIGGGPNLLDENIRMSAVQHMSELSNQNHPATNFKSIPEQDRFRNYWGKSQVHISSSASDKRINEINYANMLQASEVAAQSFGSANFISGDNAKLVSITDKLCNFSALSQGMHCHSIDEMQNQSASDMQSTGQLFLRLGGSERISTASEAGKCSQEMLDGCLPSKYSFAVSTNSLTGRYDQKAETILAEFKDQEGDAGNVMTTLLGPKLGETYTFAKKVDSSAHNENVKQNIKKAECNSFLWRDVPGKVVAKCSLACVENSGDSPNRNVECKVTVSAEVAQNCFDESANNVGSFKEREISNVSSGCSTPVVTHASIEVNNRNSFTVDAEDARCGGNPVVDEGSGIERCWSSDDGVDSERSAECFGFASKLNLEHKRPSKAFPSKPDRSLIDELRIRDSLRLRKMQKQSHTGSCNQENGNLMQKSERDSKIWKRRPVKWKKLTSSFSPSAVSVLHNDTSECAGEAGLCSVKDIPMLSQCGQGKSEGRPCAVGQNIKRRSTLYSSTHISLDRVVCRIHDVEEEKTNTEMNLNANGDYSEASEALGRKQLRLSGATQALKQIHVHRSSCIDSDVAAKETPINSKMTCSQPGKISQRLRRPVVCGKYGVIANANSLKPTKLVSLRKLLKAPRKCRLLDTNKVDFSSVKLLKKANIKGSSGCFYESSKIKEEINGIVQHAVYNELNPQRSVEEMKTACSLGSKECGNLSHVMKKRRCGGNKIQGTPDGCQIIQLRRKYKEVRKRSLHELTTKENHSSQVKFPIMKDVKSIPQTKSRFLCKLAENAEDDKISANEICNAKKSTKDDKCQYTQDSDVFCSVCGSSNKDENNDILECSGCLIKVHQACYGIPKVPKAHWCCRPCKTSSKNIVCVLCGYGGGAMTWAFHSHNIVKSLLQAWNITTESDSKNPSSSKSLENQIKMLSSSNSVDEGDSLLLIGPAQKDMASLATEVSEHMDSISILSPAPASVACNSIMAGVLDSTIKQWVHMVCGLWTPGTHCANVDTMSAFDVSGACTSKPDAVCSICERAGGSCIECRVIGCNIQFHPWCAHQKGLLQSEVEGDDNKNVGFYGRCLHHAMNHHFESDKYHIDSGNANDGKKKLTCARTEGYKGRKQDGIHYNLPHHSDGCGGCLSVPQEQLDAWIHINRQKPCRKGPPKLSTSEIERDCRKEYARYKQSRGWKHLVVYKSGIHGLGLYTSQFISRGAMVVEYVGEIVGLRVADKRETEYQSGKKLQYKSACYFFRIDKEHIIDATRKGGIARFVNHSCQPNCVAEIIPVRNEKKVVFFAERDIYPGEEITYDYHFNHEDEGKKIPCYCNSKNCRRYLN